MHVAPQMPPQIPRPGAATGKDGLKQCKKELFKVACNCKYTATYTTTGTYHGTDNARLGKDNISKMAGK